MDVRSFLQTVVLVCVAQAAHAEITRSDCSGLREADLEAVEKVERIYACLDLLARQPAPDVLTFSKPDEYGAGWSTYPGYRNFEFAKGADGMVRLRGMMAGCPSEKTAIFKLPEGHRPKKGVRLILSTLGAGGNSRARVDITDDGKVYFWYSAYQPACSGRSHWLTLEGLQFQGEQ